MTGLHRDPDQCREGGDRGLPDQTGCQGWNNSFGFNNSRATTRRRSSTRRAGPLPSPCPAKNNCGSLPASMVYDPVTNPTRNALRQPDLYMTVWGTTTGIGRWRPKPGAVDQRQRRRAVQLQGAPRRRDHRRGVRDAEPREDRRRRCRFERDRRPFRGRYGAHHRLSRPASSRAAEPGQGRDSRGYDEQGIHYNWRNYSGGRASTSTPGRSRQPGHLALRHGALPGAAAQIARVRPECRDHGHVAVESGQLGSQAFGERGAHASAGGRRQARGGLSTTSASSQVT